jgi:hypothetical protein
VQIVLATPANNERGPRYMEKALAAIHQALKPGQTIQLGYCLHESQIAVYVRFPVALQEVVLGPLIANYPRASVQVVNDDAGEPESQKRSITTWTMYLRLVPELFPILRHAQFEDMLTGTYADPIDSLLRALRPEGNVRCSLEINATPAHHRRTHRAKDAIERLESPFFRHHPRLGRMYANQAARNSNRLWKWLFGRLLPSGEHTGRASPLDIAAGYRHEREADLQAAADKIGGHLFDVSLRLVATAPLDAERQARDRLRALTGALGAFTRSRLATFACSTIKRGASERAPLSLINQEELATLCHPPVADIAAERMHVASFSELEAPVNLSSSENAGSVTLGRVRFRTDDRPATLDAAARRRHCYVIGRTGVGKTTLLLNTIVSDMAAGQGIGLIDVHGDLAADVLARVPRQRTNDVIILDPASDLGTGFNPLACPHGQIDLAASGIVASLKRLNESWGPRLQDTLRCAAYAVIEQQGNLRTLLEFLTDETVRARIVALISDDLIRDFWTKEFAGWSKAYRTEAVAAIVNKVRPFLTSRQIRAVVAQPGRSLDLRRLMDERKILIVRLSKGVLGEDNACLLGALLVTSIQQAAMSRADVPEEQRPDFHFYVDEFQNFFTSSWETILSEARKYRLNLTISHQLLLGQLSETTRSAILGNVGSMIAFNVGIEDAALLASALSQFPGQVKAEDLANLPRFTAIARLLIGGQLSKPFSITTLPPPVISEDRTAIVLEASRRQFGTLTRSPPSSNASQAP